ncbi:MAG: Stk1 family PASTA domain-containing Ser/Thr kinase [Propioniciclava sp.]
MRQDPSATGTDHPNDRPRVLGGRYEIGSVIGRGGMAVVSRAHDRRLHREVAVKELRIDLASDPTFQARFRREAHASAGLGHPNIVAVYDTGEERDPSGVGVPYIVMELIHGRTLREILQEGRPILPRRALEFTQGVLAALAYSHRKGIIHRDIKPANVMLGSDGTIKVMDFGIARAVADTSATMTQTAAVIGTAQYLSPEQARGETVDARSDVYAAGCLMYELLVGRPPFQGDSPVSVAYQHVRETPVPPSQIDPEVTAPMDAVVGKALAKRPEDRYQDADEMREDINRILGGQRVEATLPPPVPPLVAAASTAVLAAETAQLTGGPATTGTQTAVAEDDEEEEEPRRSRALWWTMGIIVALFAIGAGVFVYLNGEQGPRTVTVPPGLLGQTQAVAEEMVTEAGLVPEVKTVQGADDNTIGTVTGVNPLSGTDLKEGDPVTLTVNVGPVKATIPTGLTGMSYDEAKQALEDAGFDSVRPSDASESDEPPSAKANEVLSVSPQEGQEVSTAETVTLTVATGKARVPEGIAGRPVAEAKSQLEQFGFSNFTETEEVSADAAPGTVIRTIPAPGLRIGKDDPIELIVAVAPPEPTPPAETPPPGEGEETP